MTIIYHIAEGDDWENALETGEYRRSTRGRSLEEVGFIHAAQSSSQVEGVANAFYVGAEKLLLLAIDQDRIQATVRYDDVPGWDVPFPHIYGPLNTDAVVKTVPFEPGPDGRFSFPAET